jgi:2-methylisocitrate lyase-like PEP mutase family enzyme
MDMNLQREKAETFRRMHNHRRILVLPNAWDAASARVFEGVGFKAVATTSAGVAYALGYPDGEIVPLDMMVAAVGRIAQCVNVPVTADMESGFARDTRGLAKTVQMIIEAGAIGMNLEDSNHTAAARELYDLPVAVDRVRAAREAASAAGVPLVINARTDVFLLGIGEKAGRYEHAVGRANAYREAGADSLFVPGVRDAETIAALVRGIKGPMNILAGPGTPPAPELERLGVARVSVGSGPTHAAMTLTRKIGEELMSKGTYEFLNGAITYPEANALMGKRGS